MKSMKGTKTNKRLRLRCRESVKMRYDVGW